MPKLRSGEDAIQRGGAPSIAARKFPEKKEASNTTRKGEKNRIGSFSVGKASAWGTQTKVSLKNFRPLGRGPRWGGTTFGKSFPGKAVQGVVFNFPRRTEVLVGAQFGEGGGRGKGKKKKKKKKAWGVGCRGGAVDVSGKTEDAAKVERVDKS